MACGCKERGAAIVAAAQAIAAGDKQGLAKATSDFTRTVRDDAGRLRDAARSRLALGRR